MDTNFFYLRESNGRRSFASKMRVVLLALLTIASVKVAAVPMYDTGPLDFSTNDQSMWSDGPAFVRMDEIFLGPEWQNATASIGGIIGGVSQTNVPTNPLWWLWQACPFLCGSEPDPKVETVTIDTRTGAQLDITSSGKFGLEFGYSINSGSVDADVGYSAKAVLPSKSTRTDILIDLNPTDSLDSGSIMSQSPNAEAWMNAVAELSVDVGAKACLALTGCVEGSTNLVNLNETLEILSLDPNALEVLPNLLPGAGPSDPREALISLDTTPAVELSGGLTTTPNPPFVAPAFEVSAGPLSVQFPPSPGPTVFFDLAEITFDFPIIATSGSLNGAGTAITSGGRSDVLGLFVDLDGVATLSGVLPPLGFSFDLIDIGVFKAGFSIDLLDIDMGPTLGLTQDFELTPTLMVTVDFSSPVTIPGLSGPQTSWTGAWDDFPAFAALRAGELILTPTFWIDAMLTNAFGLDLGLSGTLDLFKMALVAEVAGQDLSTNPLSLNSLLQIGNTLFETPKLEIPIGSLPTFRLGGFDPVVGQRIVLAIPEPGTVALLLMATVILIGQHRRRLGAKMAH